MPAEWLCGIGLQGNNPPAVDHPSSAASCVPTSRLVFADIVWMLNGNEMEMMRDIRRQSCSLAKKWPSHLLPGPFSSSSSSHHCPSIQWPPAKATEEAKPQASRTGQPTRRPQHSAVLHIDLLAVMIGQRILVLRGCDDLRFIEETKVKGFRAKATPLAGM